MSLHVVHARRLRRVGVVTAAVVTIALFLALLASPAWAADEPKETIFGDAAARAGVPPPPPSGPPGAALPELEEPARPVESEPQPTRWYGWQTLLGDGAAALLLLYGSGGRSGESLAVASVLTYGLAAPTVHLAHARPGAALGSLGARAGLPVAGFAVGVVLGGGSSACRELCGLPVILGAAGALTAIGLDAAVLANEPARHRTRPPHEALVQRLTPSVAPRREGGVDVALGGTF
jgi:hypothetical protein